MTERKERVASAQRMHQEELEAEAAAEREYEELLRQEASRMSFDDYEPQVRLSNKKALNYLKQIINFKQKKMTIDQNWYIF